MRPERPNLLGFVCWVLIIGNMADIYRTMKSMGSPAFDLSLEGFPYPPLYAEIILFGTMAVFIICAILMYEGQGWARYIYFANMILYVFHHHVSASLDTTPNHRMLILEAKIVFFAISIVIVYLPSVRRYFRPPVYVDE
jgi:hypothetical protein